MTFSSSQQQSRPPVDSRNSVLCILLGLWAVIFGVTGTPRASAQDQDDRSTMLILAPAGPVLAELRLSVDQQPYRDWVARYLGRQLDMNRSGTLDRAEFSVLNQELLQLVQARSVDEIFESLRLQPDAEAVSSQEFASWFRDRLPETFDVYVEATSADQSVRLARFLDINEDGRVDADELTNGARALRFRDLDDDETFTAAELNPLRDPRNTDADISTELADLPFVQLTSPDRIESATVRILRRYGDGSTVPAARLRGLEPTAEGEGDPLDSTAVKALLRSGGHHLTVRFLLSDRPNRSMVEVNQIPESTAWCTAEQESQSRVRLNIDGLPMLLIARGGSSRGRYNLEGFIGQSFFMTDEDRNRYLDADEFLTFTNTLSQAGLSGTFREVDSDNDNMITREELLAFAKRDTVRTQSRVEVSIKQSGRTLFGLLDSNIDRRLSRRELLEGFGQIREYDLNQDGALGETELGTEYVLTVGLGRMPIRRQPPSMMNANDPGAGDAILPGTTGLEGPDWFQRMDRNQDGDVSWREFPGTKEHFRFTDTDGNGLIDASEATAVSSKKDR